MNNRHRNRGFTLIEILIALAMVSIVMTGALRLFRSVNTSVSGSVDRMDAMQNLRFGITQIDLLLRNAGAGTTDAQPTLIYITPNLVAFNADWISPIPNSPTAVNYNPDVNPNATDAPTVAQKFIIPGTSIYYPDSTYRTSGAISPAETIIYYFEKDTSTSRTDDYHLMRQVNNNSPDEVAKNFLVYPGHDFFEWLKTDTAGNLVQVASTSLPWRHTNPIHGSLTDTGAVARIDSIRAVRVYAYATNGQTGSREVLRSLVTTIRIPNAGLAIARTCGDVPIFTQSVSVQKLGTYANPIARVRWNAATDQTSGEKDVERYLIYRMTVAGSFDDALAEVPAGQASYLYDDTSVLPDSQYVYGVTALDCTPLESARQVMGGSVGPWP
jgi:prepilin-type N-terminal cleavage/methylation domain-containing protein